MPEGSCIVFLLHDSYGDGIFNDDAYTITVDGEFYETGTMDAYEHVVVISCWDGGVCDTADEVVVGDHIAENGNYWYTFTPDANGMYLVSTCDESNLCDTRLWIYDYCYMAVFDDSNEGTIYYDDNEGGCGDLAQVNALLEAGVTYWIRIGGSFGDCGTNDLAWSVIYNGVPEGCMDPEACNYAPYCRGRQRNLYLPWRSCLWRSGFGCSRRGYCQQYFYRDHDGKRVRLLHPRGLPQRLRRT